VIILSASGVRQDFPFLQDLGGLIGAAVSGTFLWIIGVLNLLVLLDILNLYKRSGRRHDRTHVEILFTAGMSLTDATDGVLMYHGSGPSHRHFH
jgi:high-affinity nickel-transport protein